MPLKTCEVLNRHWTSMVVYDINLLLKGDLCPAAEIFAGMVTTTVENVIAIQLIIIECIQNIKKSIHP